jgi:hypothetical protein
MKRIFLSLVCLWLGQYASSAQTVAAAEAETAKCLDRIASVQREILGKYEDQLAILQEQFQKAADLDNALVIRNERQRLRTDGKLLEKDFVNEPRALRTIQSQSASKLAELMAALVNETVPRLVEVKKALTIAGRLDDAVAVRSLIEKLQNDHLPLARPSSAEIIPVETLLVAYAADRARADKVYKGAQLTVRGTIGAFRPDQADARNYVVYLNRGTTGGWVGCIFNTGTYRFREDKQFNSQWLIVMDRSGEVRARLQVGQSIDVQGVCEGFEDVARLAKCELPK